MSSSSCFCTCCYIFVVYVVHVIMFFFFVLLMSLQLYFLFDKYLVVYVFFVSLLHIFFVYLCHYNFDVYFVHVSTFFFVLCCLRRYILFIPRGWHPWVTTMIDHGDNLRWTSSSWLTDGGWSEVMTSIMIITWSYSHQCEHLLCDVSLTDFMYFRIRSLFINYFINLITKVFTMSIVYRSK